MRAGLTPAPTKAVRTEMARCTARYVLFLCFARVAGLDTLTLSVWPMTSHSKPEAEAAFMMSAKALMASVVPPFSTSEPEEKVKSLLKRTVPDSFSKVRRSENDAASWARSAAISVGSGPASSLINRSRMAWRLSREEPSCSLMPPNSF